jgi:S-adenosylmethionine:tRNA ribosyltransferase-isomerase
MPSPGEGRSARPEPPAAGFEYVLPPELIAQRPPPEREAARLLVVARSRDQPPVHSSIRELTRWLRAGDVLVVNRSRVVPARLRARRAGGGVAEVLLVAPLGGLRWKALVRPAGRLRPGQRLTLVRPLEAPTACASAAATHEVVVVRLGDGHAEVEFPPGTDVAQVLARFGEPPLPPYIRRPHGALAEDWRRYQTVFAAEPGSIAAPTAGLHLGERVLAELRAAGVEIAELVLHVGPATFLSGRPGRATLAVEPESYVVPRATRDLVLDAKGRRRIVAVGTTTTRALESAALAGWPEGMQTTSLVLAPGARFEVVDALLTNFHLPGSSLLALVSAFGGVDTMRRAYEEAVSARYRFYSYGDAMLIV